MSRFDEKARDWDTPERQAHALAAATSIREAVPLDRSMRVIDLGAGTGLLGLALADDVASVVLAEPSAGMLEVARQKLAAAGPANVTAVEYDLPGDPPAGAPFDLAVSMLVLHHIQETGLALRAVHELLAPGGRIAILDLAAEDGTFHDADSEGIHHHGFQPSELTATAATAGFTDVELRVVSSIEKDGRDYPVLLLTGRRT